MTTRSTERAPMRPARLAEMVAGVLRDRILSGELPDGGWLPKQEDLLAEFGISMPPIREALRILESEGLITVKRGNVGGAVVHLPREAAAALTFGVLLHSRGATLRQLVDAMFASNRCASPQPRTAATARPRCCRYSVQRSMRRSPRTTMPTCIPLSTDASTANRSRRAGTQRWRCSSACSSRSGQRTSITLHDAPRSSARTPSPLPAGPAPASTSAFTPRSLRAIRGLPTARRAHTADARGNAWQIDLTRPVDASLLCAVMGR